MAIELLSSEIVFEGKVFDVRIDQVRLAGDLEARIDLVIHSGAVAIVPVDKDGSIWFVKQYRHATGNFLLELPAGTLEPAEEPASAAARESREEIGMAPGNLESLGGFYLAPGYSNEYLNVFLATDLESSALSADPDEMIEVQKMGASDVLDRLRNGGFQDAKTLAALQLADAKHGILTGS